MAIDGVLESKEMGPLLEDSYTLRYGKWYILIEVHDEEFNDCLSPRYEYRDQVEGFLNDFRKEYCTIQSYNELLLKQ